MTQYCNTVRKPEKHFMTEKSHIFDQIDLLQHFFFSYSTSVHAMHAELAIKMLCLCGQTLNTDVSQHFITAKWRGEKQAHYSDHNQQA